MRHLLSIADLDDDEVDALLRRATQFADGANTSLSPFTAALLFLSSSLRTRLGFGVAIARLGGSLVDVSEMRWDPNMSAAESFDDALRTVTGMVDAAVVRAPLDLTEPVGRWAACPVVCGGDSSSHPSQALIDVFAMERLRGPIDQLSVAIAGDHTMRATRSLLELFRRRPPRELVLIGPPSRRIDVELGGVLSSRTREASLDDLSGIDVLSMSGLAPKRDADYLDDSQRSEFCLSARHLAGLPGDAIVLSPMPVIDEIGNDARVDERLRMFVQSDLSVFVRMAVVEHMLHGARH